MGKQVTSITGKKLISKQDLIAAPCPREAGTHVPPSNYPRPPPLPAPRRCWRCWSWYYTWQRGYQVSFLGSERGEAGCTQRQEGYPGEGCTPRWSPGLPSPTALRPTGVTIHVYVNCCPFALTNRCLCAHFRKKLGGVRKDQRVQLPPKSCGFPGNIIRKGLKGCQAWLRKPGKASWRHHWKAGS